MSLVTVSTKRRRVYQRKFDHELAKEMYAAGATIREMADLWDVDYNAVRRIVVPGVREQMDETQREWNKAICEDCGGECTNSVAHNRGRKDRVVCLSCSHERQREEGLLRRLDANGDIRCGRCKTHQPVTAYTLNKWGYPRARCRACETEMRRVYRQTHPEQVARERERDRLAQRWKRQR